MHVYIVWIRCLRTLVLRVGVPYSLGLEQHAPYLVHQDLSDFFFGGGDLRLSIRSQGRQGGLNDTAGRSFPYLHVLLVLHTQIPLQHVLGHERL